MSILKDTGLDWRDRFLIRALYLDQTAYGKVGIGMSGERVIGRDVCLLCYAIHGSFG